MKMLKNIFPFLLILGLMLFAQTDLVAQCPMCRMTAESNMQHGGGTEGKGLNNGILFLLSMPYLLIATLAYIWWRNKKKNRELELEG
ncbi:MAG: hypothetical protein D6772_01750 [Bacteroidetes bacterium]|nr:MAG: hypothetical protein D6772_01750 [Bacteroidota bacterium]